MLMLRAPDRPGRSAHSHDRLTQPQIARWSLRHCGCWLSLFLNDRCEARPPFPSVTPVTMETPLPPPAIHHLSLPCGRSPCAWQISKVHVSPQKVFSHHGVLVCSFFISVSEQEWPSYLPFCGGAERCPHTHALRFMHIK